MTATALTIAMLPVLLPLLVIAVADKSYTIRTQARVTACCALAVALALAL